MWQNLKAYLQRWDHLFGMAKNAGWLTVERLIRLGVGFFIGIWIARYFGPDIYSLFTYSLAIVVMFRAIAGLGLRSIFVREFVARPERGYGLLGTSAAMMGGAAIFCYLLAVLTAWLLNASANQTHLIVAVLAIQILLYPTEVVNYFFEAKVQSKFTVISRLTGYLVGLIIKLAILLCGGDIIHLAIAYALDLSVVALMYLYMGHREGIAFGKWRWEAETAKGLLKDSRYLVLAAVMVTLYMQIDKPMIFKLAGQRENGYYSFAVQLAEACYFLPVVVQQSAFPNLVASGRRDENEFLLKISKLFRILFYLSVVVAVFFTFTATPIVDFLSGGKYTESGKMLSIVIWALPFVSSGLVQSAYLVSKNLLAYSLYLTAMGMVCNIALNLVLIPELGGIGAALTTVLSYSIAGFFGGFLFPKTRPLTYIFWRSILWQDPLPSTTRQHDD